VLALALLALGGCRRPTDLPGEALGQYEVRGALEENTCGDGYAAPSQLWFHVEIRDAPGSELGWWKLPDAPLASGTVSADRAFRFEHDARVVATPAQPELGRPGCELDRVETVEGTLSGAVGSDAGTADGGVRDGSVDDAGPAPAAPGIARLEGTTTIRVSAAPGGDCSALIGTGAGQFPALPCEIRFRLTGERLEEEIW
jgi:hypothetical protein